jgi:Tfp pilus assembly protein PilO
MVRGHFLWGVVFVLFIACAVQLVIWRNLREDDTTLSSQSFTAVTQKHQQLRTHINRAKERLGRLESTTLWKQPHQILPLLGKVATELSVKLVGVEELPPHRVAGYQSFPLHLTFSGDYEGFSTFMSIVEKISPPVRMDGLRIYQREQYPGTLWMSLIIAPMYGEEDQGTPPDIEVPATPYVVFGRDAFTFGIDEASIGPPPTKGAEDTASLKMPLPTLTGILWSENQPIAIFTDHQQRPLLAHRGEVIAGATVIDIQPQYVVLRRGAEKHELRLWEELKMSK